MDADIEGLQALVQRDRIRDCIARLARGEDRRDPDLIRSAYWPDATTDYGVFAGSFDDYFAWVYPGADAITNTQHVLGQSVIEIDGDAARVETHVVSYHRVDMGAGERDTCIGGRYLDVLTRRDGLWRIAARTMLYDWYQDWGDAIDWSHGVMGLPFSAPHFAGRAVGDHSAAFFSAAR
ncbi:nuclear transport factor 2 family protein [Sphingomonas naphthae]|uniref:Nuclear transport factor 2 family protein n=1 Tax=Sphingomonas naphthae TaxID=1813468 RepID=A0ABY7TRZ6_9SPHN|nr:nuclear transport factor 2 family protein [Sphingomonas naphthae]WCT75175.1 nuclear transport factor 2 family protein [Sphingomonas naphthae]